MPQKIQGFSGEILKEKIVSLRPSVGHKTNQNDLDKQEYEEFETALQHKSKLQVYGHLKREIGFEGNLEYVKEAPS